MCVWGGGAGIRRREGEKDVCVSVGLNKKKGKIDLKGGGVLYLFPIF